MDIAEWRKKIDELDRQIVLLISERARAGLGDERSHHALFVG